MELDLQNYARILQSCNTHNFILLGKQLHSFFLKKGILSSTITIGNRLLQLYSRCSTTTETWKLFDEMPHRNCFSWNTVIEGYMKSGNKEKSLELFKLIPHKNDFSWNLVISGLAKAGELEVARDLFDNMPRKNGVAWNSMIHGYARHGNARKAVELFKDLGSLGDSFVLATVIGACVDLGAIEYGKQIHAHMVVEGLEFDPVLWSALINLYGKCGDLDSASRVLNLMKEPDDFSLSALISGYASCGRMTYARRLFDKISDPSVVLWNSLISGHALNNEEIEALALFNKMREKKVQEDFSSIAVVLSACSSLCISEHVKQMHGHAHKIGVIHDVIIASTLIDAYSKCGRPNDACKFFSELQAYDTVLLNSMITVYSSCGRIEDAKYLFKTMPTKSLISWNSMIVGLSQNGCPIEALDTFCKMNKLDLMMDKFSLASVISACASISCIELGEQVFAKATLIGLESDQVISTSLVDFYCKCGLVEYGKKIFDTMTKSDEISWNSMLMGYATNGHGFEALALFNEMRNAGARPTDITFTGVLSACDHCGLLEEGRKWFDSMKWDYHIDPGIEHYSCMVDLYARAGCLEEAMNLIEQMPFKEDVSLWSSVLRGCVAHGDKSLGKKVAERIIELDPENSGAYVQLSSLFATSGEWETSAAVRSIMREKQIKKNPGCSWAES
ncbi:Pentatricopeptide repeat (PPR) superfamily protein, putative [Theobroma cacao]|uniref:Pentatricopeptide repeat (PPR) superfamily protein, putative n=1 Tax=Theobroma cacao TaxID=3641 RepID=A0A061FPP6_THECC|nr:Pentatricopeptide repeat (PPR) superfamily protein, putative [Theobroma cacao]